MNRRCEAHNARGLPCSAAPLVDARYCFAHDPEHADEAAAARRSGGLRRRREGTIKLALQEVFAANGHEPLDSEDQTVVAGTWRLLAELVETDGDDIERLQDTPSALDREGRLVEPARLYFEDRPRLTALFGADVQTRIIAFDPDTEPALRHAGVRDLGEAITVAKLEPGHPAPAEQLDGLIADRSGAIRRAIETGLRSGGGRVRALEEFSRQVVAGLTVQYELNSEPGPPTTERESPDALFIEAEDCLFVQAGVLPIFAVARELAIALSGPRSVGSVSPALATILAAADVAAAHRALDDLGFATIAEEVEFVPAAMATATALGSEQVDAPGVPAEPDEPEAATPPEVGERVLQPDDRPGAAGHPGGSGGAKDRDDGVARKGGPARHTKAKTRQHQRDVLRSYVAAPFDDEDDGIDDVDDTEDEGPDVNRAGVDAVLAYEKARGRFPEEMSANNPGFDVLSRRADGEIDRYIEVKSRSDSWLDAQTALSPRQHDMAHERGDTFWLYVVERAGLETSEIWTLQNPIGRATRFGFDHGWKAVATDEPPTSAVGTGDLGEATDPA